MNPSPDISPPDDTASQNWREALMSLIAARIALIQLESRDSIQRLIKLFAYIAGAVICFVTAWLLLLIAAIAALSELLRCPWHWIVSGLAILHLIVAAILLKLAKPTTAVPPFPATRAEFQKDRQWIENFQKNKKSNG